MTDVRVQRNLKSPPVPAFRALQEILRAIKGAIGIDAQGPGSAILWLDGGYDVPLSLFGKFLDTSLAAGAAQRTLENFIGDITAACTALVEKREAEFVRYRMFER